MAELARTLTACWIAWRRRSLRSGSFSRRQSRAATPDHDRAGPPSWPNPTPAPAGVPGDRDGRARTDASHRRGSLPQAWWTDPNLLRLSEVDLEPFIDEVLDKARTGPAGGISTTEPKVWRSRSFAHYSGNAAARAERQPAHEKGDQEIHLGTEFVGGSARVGTAIPSGVCRRPQFDQSVEQVEISTDVAGSWYRPRPGHFRDHSAQPRWPSSLPRPAGGGGVPAGTATAST